MESKSTVLTFAIGITVLAFASSASSGQSGALVRLQPVTPGVSQAGHANLSGSIRAGQFVGGGSGVTSVNATLLDGIDSTGFALAAHTHSASAIVSGTFADSLLSANVALLSGTQTFSGTKTFSAISSFSNATRPFNVTSTGLVTNLNADKLDGLDASSFLTSVPVPLSLVGSVAGTSVLTVQNTSTTTSSVAGFFSHASNSGYAVAGQATSTSGSTSGVFGESFSVVGRGVTGQSLSATGTNHGVYGSAASDAGRGVGGFSLALTGFGSGVFGQSESPTGYGVQGLANSVTGSNFGVYGRTRSTSGYGVFGSANSQTGAPTALAGEVQSPDGIGVYGLNTSNTGTGLAGLFVSESSTGQGIFSTGHHGVYGTSFTTTGRGVFGESTNTSTGSSFGVYGVSASASGRGVYGFASTTTDTGQPVGVMGETGSQSGIGVFGRTNANVGQTTAGYFYCDSRDGRAVYAIVDATASGASPYGVFAQVDTATSGYAIFANGDLGASGLKPFRIDHPLDPYNKYLLHYSAESPFPQNFYSGNVTTDEKGRAWVELPEYFAEINTNFKYQLTVVDDLETEEFVQAKVGRKIRENRFLIMTSAPNIEVSWRVEADRNDGRVKANRPSDVREKVPLERGKLQQPEYYGQPKNSGTFAPRH
ncbi:MAG TPA: hypothetical protein PKA27_03220 [Fimbriimonadaceae bacterium]|nr:hypothetical protein [Fimbriimonadaceae bacterium]